MLLCDLPADILVIVLGRCLVATSNATDDFKRNLPLLAAFRLWRRLAIPLVYSRVFVQYGDEPVRRFPYTHNPDMEEPTDAAIKTNLDLVAMVGCAGLAKCINIVVYYSVNPFPGWQEVIQRMRTVAIRWRAMDLTVAMLSDHYTYVRNVDVAKYADDTAEVGDELAALVPDVCRLECKCFYRDPIAQSLHGRLASHYADQLWRFDCQHPIIVPMGCRFARLKWLQINYNYQAEYQPPQMAIGELVDMRLAAALANHSWAPFSTDSDSHEIEFTKLRRLDVSYNAVPHENGVAVRHRDGHPWKLRLPSLKSLSIYCSGDICPLLEYAVLPPRMESISIEMRSASYLDIANVVLPATKRISLSIDGLFYGVPNGLPVANRLLDNAHGSEELQLSILHSEPQLVPEDFSSTALTHLEIFPPTDGDSMFAIIQRLPSLVKLELHDVDFHNIQADMSIPDADEDTAVEPLSLSLECLSVHCYRIEHSPDQLVAIVKHILLRIPTLAQLYATHIPVNPVLGFVAAYAPRYPHLTSVELKCDDGSGSDYTLPSVEEWH